MFIELNQGVLLWEKGTIQLTTFPGGEPHIKLKEYLSDFSNKEIDILIRIKSFNDIGYLLIVIDSLRRLNNKINTLTIPYFPGARQDRLFDGQAFTVEVYANIINSLEIPKIITYDAHSDVVLSLVKNIVNISSEQIWKNTIREYIQGKSNIIFISPDKGGIKRVSQISGEDDIIFCSKVRDLETTKITHFSVNTEENLEGKHAILIDDICDGGGTVLGIVKSLKEKGVTNISLFITHGIFSKGLERLENEFDIIYTTNSFSSSYSGSKIKMIDII